MGEVVVVHHYGPDPRAIGGMESVIATLTEHSIGADTASAHITWSMDRRLLSTARGLLEVALLSRVPRDAVVHVHLSERGSFLREGGILLRAARRGNPTVASIHGAEFLRFREEHPRLVRAVLMRAAAITCLSEDVAEAVRQTAPGRLVELVANPVAEISTALGPVDAPPMVLFAGELGTRKGADILAEAWPLVRREIEDARCVMVGPRTDLHLPDLPGLTIMQGLPRAGVARLLGEARVIALPSRAEGMPMILTEALAAGRPFVATPVGGIPELAHADGMLVSVGDPAELARGLIAFLADPALAQSVGDAGRKFWRRTRSVHAIDRRLRVIYASARDQ